MLVGRPRLGMERQRGRPKNRDVARLGGTEEPLRAASAALSPGRCSLLTVVVACDKPRQPARHVTPRLPALPCLS